MASVGQRNSREWKVLNGVHRCDCQDTQGSLEMIAVSELWHIPTIDGDAEVRYLIRSL